MTNNVKPIIGNYLIHYYILGQVHNVKYFGVYMDYKLTFNALVDAVNMASWKLGAYGSIY